VVRAQSGDVISVAALEPSGARLGRPFIAYQVPYHDSEWFEYGFTLLNDAPFPVTVDQIGINGEGDPTRQVSVSISEQDDAFGPGLPDKMVPFQRFIIPSHGARFILVRGQFVGCSMHGAEDATLWAVQLVKIHMQFGPLTIHQTDYLPLAYSVRVSGSGGCPGS
jgi:hypothetical protein